jgi:hypothetical protein
LASEVHAIPTVQFEVHWQMPPDWQTPLGHEVPAVAFAHVPEVPPVWAALQLWQVPVQAVLQQTPDEQFPLKHASAEVQATPFGARAKHAPVPVLQ